MKTPIKNFDPYRPPRRLHSPGSLRNLARRIKTRAAAAVGLAGLLLLLLLLLPVSLGIAIIMVACADNCRHEHVTMPRHDATTQASDVDGGGQ